MPRLLPVLLLALLLSACATLPPASVSMTQLYGQPAEVAFGILGLPQAEQSIAGRRVYVWHEGGIASRPVFRPHRPWRYRDPWFWGPEWDEVAYSYACTLRLFVDAGGLVTGGDVRGHGGGCAGFARALAPLLPPA